MFERVFLFGLLHDTRPFIAIKAKAKAKSLNIVFIIWQFIHQKYYFFSFSRLLPSFSHKYYSQVIIGIAPQQTMY